MSESDDDVRVLKVGGGVLTDKSGYEELNEGSFALVMDLLADSKPEHLVLVHGAGSYGHPHVNQFGVENAGAVLRVRRGVETLNERVVGELIERGVKAVSVHPGSFSVSGEQGIEVPGGVISGLLSSGYTPVLHGDCFVSESGGFDVVSGDEIVTGVGSNFDVSVGLCTMTDGVLDNDGNPVPEVNAVDGFPDLGVDGVDVTGGMESKVRELLNSRNGGWIFGMTELREFLETGKPVRGTHVVSGKD
ncbi:MAG: isopentenyl phosphate kinase [Halobacteria archaeon]